MATGDIEFRLPNARAGAAYAQRLEPQQLSTPAPAPRYIRIGLPPALALRADTASGTISGIPAAAGVYHIEVDYTLAGQEGGTRRATFQFIVTPDPRSLWRDLPSDQNAPYWRPDRDCQAVAAGALRLLAASARGRAHAHRGEFRDDDFRIAHLEQSQWRLAVVADGAGSARYGRRGAQLICELAIGHLREALAGAAGMAIDEAAQPLGVAASVPAPQGPGDVQAQARPRSDAAACPPADERLRRALGVALGQAAACAVRGMAREAAAHADSGTVYADYHSTALIAACKRYPFGTLYAAYWVGDGAIGVYQRERGITLLGQADSGEYGGQTRFLDAHAVTPEALLRRTHYTIASDAAALILMSDGVSDPWFESEASLARIEGWDALWRELAPCLDGDAPRKLLDWLDFWSPGNHDDRTIAVIL